MEKAKISVETCDVYFPELGHAIFYSNNVKKYNCEKYLVALLRDIARELERVMWNRTQKEYANPFENSGNVDGFKNDIFEVHAFDWNEDSDQQYNFKYKDVEISWYKYLGRDVSINREISPEYAIRMYNNCIKSLYLMDVE